MTEVGGQHETAAFPARQPVTARTFALPPGFAPESIAIGSAPEAFVGSLADGRVLGLDLRSGAARTVAPPTGGAAGGLALDADRRLFIAGAFSGEVRVVDVGTGEQLRRFRVATSPGALVADVALTASAAVFTDARVPVLYRMPLAADGTPADHAEVVPLPDSLKYGEGFNVCGIVAAPVGDAVLLLHAGTGELHRADPSTGAAERVDLHGDLAGGDGLLRRGRTLFVALGLRNAVAVVALDAGGRRAEVRDFLDHPRFDVPTAVAEHDGTLYLPNARFRSPRTRDTRYDVIAIPSRLAAADPDH
jgi:sugar lactone lactonase YvrE